MYVLWYYGDASGLGVFFCLFLFSTYLTTVVVLLHFTFIYCCMGSASSVVVAGASESSMPAKYTHVKENKQNKKKEKGR